MRYIGRLLGVGTGALALVCWRGGIAQTPTPKFTAEQEAFFEKNVRPVLVERCFSCHTGKEPKGGLLLDSREALLRGNASGPAFVAGDPDKSLLFHVVRYDGKVKMPPTGRLRQEETAAIVVWIKMGAPWPGSKDLPADKKRADHSVVTPAMKNFWSFRPIKKPLLPKVQNKAWVKNSIDALLLAKMETKGLVPAPSVDRRTLARRAYFDLIGLPPKPEEMDAFLADKSPNAYANLIDRLLASPHYGERWGRYWLDVVRYADSNGLDENKAFAHAFRYRDYVVNAFNADKPYNQFIIEQLAGDLLPTDDEDLKRERLTATGFLVLGPKVLAEQDKPKFVMDIVDEQIEVTSKAFMGLTVACARCHDHKFDPIPTKDYYALAGIFKSTRTMADLGFVSNWLERPVPSKAEREKIQAFEAQRKELENTVRLAREDANQDLRQRLQKDADKYLRAGWELAQQGTTLSVAEAPRRRGDVLMEAEDFVRGNLGKDFSTYGQGIGVVHNIQSPDFAEWEFNLPQAGLYQLEMRYAAETSRPVRLFVNGERVRIDAAASVTGSWQPNGQRWEPQGVFAFKTGKNVLRMEQDQAIPHFDKILVVAVPERKGRPKNTPPKTAEQIAKERGLIPEVVKQWAQTLRQAQKDPLFAVWFAYASLSEEQFSQEAEAVSERIAKGEIPAIPVVAQRFKGFRPNSLEAVAERYAALFADTTQGGEGDAVRQALNNPQGILRLPEKPEAFYAPPKQVALKQRTDALSELNKNAPRMPMAMAVEDGKIENSRVHLRGNTLTLGDEAPRGFVQVLGGTKLASSAEKSSGRLELAQWITQPTHPLTARVAMNRLWQQHFGEGLVRTPDNFGLLGDNPIHKELLDWLAATFVEKGWSFKAMHRLVMLSNAYQMSGKETPKAMLTDPDNRYFWRRPRRRLEAEPLRDSLLAVSGKLDDTMGGSLLNTPNNDYVTNDQSGNGARYGAPRRSLYLPIIRNALFDMFQAFDFGDPSIVNPKRASTTVAPQALYMMNSPFVQEQSQAFAEELLKNTSATDVDRIRLAYRKAYSRVPSVAERDRAVQFLARFNAALTTKETDAAKRNLTTWRVFCQALFAANEFIYID